MKNKNLKKKPAQSKTTAASAKKTPVKKAKEQSVSGHKKDGKPAKPVASKAKTKIVSPPKMDSPKTESELPQNKVVKVGNSYGIQEKGRIVLSVEGQPVVKRGSDDFTKVKELVSGVQDDSIERKIQPRTSVDFTFAGLQ